MENRITFHSGVLTLEGQINIQSKTCAVVITHPHTLYGGDLTSPVVESIAASYARKGFTTLRFNFRGAGKSEGHFADGVGEQEDVLAAIELFRKSGIRNIHLSGYSFGAWVIGHMASFPDEVSSLIMVSPPVAFMDYSKALPQPLLKLVLAGSNDEIAPPELIRKQLPNWNQEAELSIIDDADHFFYGHFPQLEETIASRLTYCPKG